MAIDFTATIQDITIEQDSVAVITLNPVTDQDGAVLDMAGWTAAMEVKPDYNTASILTLSSPSNGINVSNGTNTITITITPTDTDTLNLGGDGLEAIYSLELTDGANKYVPMKGSFTINKQIT